MIFSRSFSNAEYFLGKALGIFSVFLLLNLAVLAITFVIHFFILDIIFALQPYLQEFVTTPQPVFGRESLTGLSVMRKSIKS